jgi:long-chain acyl-CoA synthetase
MATLASALRRTAAQFGRQPAVVDDDGRTLDWQAWHRRVAQTSSWLAGQGLRPGERFAIVGLNSARFAALLQAAYVGGFRPVPINHRLAPTEVAAILAQAGCRVWLLEPGFEALADDPALQPWRACCVRLQLDGWPAQVDGLPPAEPAEADPGDEALLLFTGGTSGRAKGVPLTHAQVLANALQVGSVLAPRQDDVVLHVAPMFHSAELVLAGSVLQGARQAYLPRFTPELFLGAVQAHRVTMTLLVPTMLLMLLHSGLIERFDVSSLRRVVYGASPMSPEAIDLAARQLPDVQLMQGYGLTETAPLLTMLSGSDHQRARGGERRERLASCGRALPAVDIRVLGDDDRELPAGQVGEIVVRGPNVFSGYLDDPAATAAAWRAGGFATGDVGRLDDEGYLFLLDRRKDVVITGGENVYSVEVENVLLQHPAVAEAAVIGVPHATYGEAVHAVLVLHDGAEADAAALQQFCRGRIGGYKIPRSFSFVTRLPRTALGKVMKSALRQAHTA